MAPLPLARVSRREAAWFRWRSPAPRLREVVVRVRHLERLVREAAQEIAELAAEVADDVVALRLDVGARPGLVLDGRAGDALVGERPAELGLVQVGGVLADRGLGDQAVGEPAMSRVDRRGRRVTGVDLRDRLP